MTMGSEPDEWLMGQVALDKREYLAPLVRRYASSLLTFIARMVGNHHRAEELVQEVFLAVWLKRRQYRFPKSLRCWLFAIAANRCRADFRRARPELAVLAGESIAADPRAHSPLASAVATESAVLVAQAVAALPERQRTVVVLRIWNGLSYAEIAEIVGAAEATVRSHMHHGLAALRPRLERHFFAEDDDRG